MWKSGFSNFSRNLQEYTYFPEYSGIYPIIALCMCVYIVCCVFVWLTECSSRLLFKKNYLSQKLYTCQKKDML